MLLRAAKVAVVIGTVLFAINQLDVVVRGGHGPGVIGKIALTYAVPFCVSLFSGVAAVRRR